MKYLLPILLLLALPVRADTLVYSCPEASADGRLMDASAAGWPNCPGAVYAAPSKALIIATLAGSPATTTWLLASKVTDESIWTQTNGVAPGAWAKASALTWDATPTPPIVVGGGTSNLTWTPPTKNADGTPLTDLAGYRIYDVTDASNLGEYFELKNPGATGYQVTGLASGTYFFAVTAVNTKGVESERSNTVSSTITSAPPVIVVPPAVNCAVSAFSAWVDTSAWSACAASKQSKTQTRTRTVTTQPANGGTACPALTETQTLTQACVAPLVWLTAKNGTATTRPVYELIRNTTDTAFTVGYQLGTIPPGKACDPVGLFVGGNWHKVSEVDATLASVTYKGRVLTAVCSKQ